MALVTGASKGGTGTAIAVRLAAEGARVAITARSVDGLERTRARIEEAGGKCLVLPSDLSDPHGARTELVARTEAELGPVDILVNNAAAGGYGAFESAVPQSARTGAAGEPVGAVDADGPGGGRDAPPRPGARS